MNAIIKTNKWWLAVNVEKEQYTLKDIITRLDAGELKVSALRKIDAPQGTDRGWKDLDTNPMGRLGVKFNSPLTNKSMEVENAGQRNLIHNKLPNWIEFGRAISRKEKEKVRVPVVKECITQEVKVVSCICEIEKYLDKLQDVSEIGAIYKLLKYLKHKGVK